MNLVENFQTRINSIDNRSVLLSLINDFDKVFNLCYCLISKHI